MDIRQLAYFVEVADQGTFTAAAKALNMSQPPLSIQIAQLERELGCRLFERSARTMRLTDAGRTLYQRARSILDLCESTRNEMALLGSGSAGTLRLGVASSVAGSLLAGWLDDFHAAFGSFRYELHEADTFRLLDGVRTDESELAIVRSPFSAPDLESIALVDEPFCAVGMPARFPLLAEAASKGASSLVSLEALAELPLIVYRRWKLVLTTEFKRKGLDLEPHLLCVCDDARTTLALAESGMGICIVPQSAIPPADESLSFRIDEPALRSEICIVYRAGDRISAPAKDFVAFMKMRYQSRVEEARSRARQ